MGFSCGIVGLPNVGKSTLFNAVTRSSVEAANYPFCTIEPNHGVVAVPDPRVDTLSNIFKSKKKIYTTVDFVDIAGLVKGASKGEGLGNQFLANIRETDAVVQVVRIFDDPDVIHDGAINPLNDIEIINTELILADLDTAEKRLDRLQKLTRSGNDKTAFRKKEILEKVREHLLSEKLLNRASFTSEEMQLIISECGFLTIKPMLIAANISENQIPDISQNSDFKKLESYAIENNYPLVELSARMECELCALNEEGVKEYLTMTGLSESGLSRLIKAGYHTLGLITFLTTGEDETRAWTIRKGATAPDAAGVIHSDFKKGFIKAEVISYEDLRAFGSYAKARENGKIRIEGKEYIIKDGDVCHFRFNV